MMKVLSIWLVAWGLAAGATARADLKGVVASFVDDRTAVLARIRLDAIGPAGALGEVETLATAYRPWLESLRKAGARDLFVVATLDDLPPGSGSSPFALVPLEDGANPKSIGALLCGGPGQGGPRAWTTCASIRGAVIAGDDATLERVRTMKGTARPDLEAALEAGGDAPFALAVATPEDLRRAIDEQVASLPEELGGGPASLASRGLKWASISGRPDGTPAIRLQVQTADPAAAAKLLTVVGKGVELMRGERAVLAFVPGFEALADALAFRVEGDRIAADLSAESLALWVRAVVGPVEEKSDRRDCVRNLLTLGLAMHNYHSEHNAFPPPRTVDAAGKPLLSWRVLILPFLDANDLYMEFHLDEPWDSPHNKALIPRMPAVFACRSELGGSVAKGMTVYKRPVGEVIGVSASQGLAIPKVTDGTSNTIMIVETPAAQAVEWTRPDDWDVPATPDAKNFFIRHVDGANVSFMDGSVRFFGPSLKPDVLHGLLTPAGHEVLGDDF